MRMAFWVGVQRVAGGHCRIRVSLLVPAQVAPADKNHPSKTVDARG